MGPGPTVVAAGSAPARPRPGSPRLGEILLAEGRIAGPALDGALAAQPRSGLRLGEILVARALVPREAVTAALGAQWSMGIVDPAAALPDPALVARADPALCLALPCLPWRRAGGTTILALADPARMGAAVRAAGLEGERVAFALADPERLRSAAARSFRGALRRRALLRSPPDRSCRSWGAHSSAEGALVLALALATLAALVLLAGPEPVLGLLLVVSVLATGSNAALRVAALVLSFRDRPAPPPSDLPRLADFRPLPRVSILVPLYRETAVLDPLLEALSRLDYPRELLEIRLVIEEDDAPMVAALAARSLPPTTGIIAVPADRLRTKPRALNYALDFVQGDIVGVYDAEDRPDPGQIAAVAAAFAASPPDVACLQARLGYYNARRNWLTRLFAIEYATWFGLVLDACERLGLPLPLGGTSLFVRRAVLEEVGAWDAHNVTEDADLGMRLARAGYRTRIIASVTLEEATETPGAWIRQRSRWLKGYLATWISHMRRPRRLWRDLGTAGFLGFQVLLLGGVVAFVTLPLLWLVWAFALAGLVPDWIAALPPALPALLWGTLLAGQAALFLAAWRACAVTGQRDLAPWILTQPAYWALGAVAALRAVAELALAPFRWHKTEHGRSRMARGTEGPGAGLRARLLAPFRGGGGRGQPPRAASSRSRVS